MPVRTAGVAANAASKRIAVEGNDLAHRVGRLVAPTIEGLGFDIVRVQVSGGARPTLQIMAEPTDEREMTIDDCADISRAVSAVLDVEDPINDRYTLEVSTPGLDRPLVRLRDYERFAGFEAKVETKELVDGKRKFRGRLGGIEGEDVFLDVDGGYWRIAFTDIAKGKLVVTDDMLKTQGKETEQ